MGAPVPNTPTPGRTFSPPEPEPEPEGAEASDDDIDRADAKTERDGEDRVVLSREHLILLLPHPRKLKRRMHTLFIIYVVLHLCWCGTEQQRPPAHQNKARIVAS